MQKLVELNSTRMGFSIVLGTVVTLALFLAINILAFNRSKVIDHRPLLVVDLMSWSTPEKPKIQQPKKLPPKKLKPKPKKPRPKKVSTPKPAPTVKPTEIIEEITEVPTPQDIEVAIELPLTKETSNEEVNSIPTPVPTFRLTHSPRFIHRETPAYPEIMRSSGRSGVVKLEILIDKTGRVRQINITKSAGKYFDNAAKDAILASRFFPAKIDSEPVAALLRLPVKFGLL